MRLYGTLYLLMSAIIPPKPGLKEKKRTHLSFSLTIMEEHK
jgi:uncharacterized membrane protein